MSPPSTSTPAILRGSCHCGHIIWTTSTAPSDLDFDACHCATCASQSRTSSGAVVFAKFPNASVHVTSNSLDSSSSTRLNMSGPEPLRIIDSSDIAQRGFCPECDTLIWMRYHLKPDDTDVNLMYIEDEEVRDGFVKRVRDRIFVKEGELEDWREKGYRCWTEFDEGFEERLKRWRDEGGKRRD